MKRTNIYKNDAEYGEPSFIGWFDIDKATVLAEHKAGNPYTTYSLVYLTAGDKIVLETSNNSGMSPNCGTISGRKAVELINLSGTEEGEAWAKGKGSKDFIDAEIK